MNNNSKELMRQLLPIWADFESRLDAVPIISKINRGKINLEDYKMILLNHRHQVIDGASWITRAASNISAEYINVRTSFIKHAATEQHDYKMLEDSYVSIGGNISDFNQSSKNIGSEALSAWMYQRASLPNPFDLLGAMFIIEGLGKNKAGYWAKKIRRAMDLSNEQVKFYLYHSENDEDHMEEFEELLNTGILDIAGVAGAIIKTAKVTGRLYLLQLEEIGNY